MTHEVFVGLGALFVYGVAALILFGLMIRQWFIEEESP